MLMFLVFTFLVGTLISLFIEGAYFGQNQMNIINALTGFNVQEETSTVGTLFAYPKMAIGFFTVGIPKILLWDYSFLEGGWSLVKWLLLYPISAGIVFGIVSWFFNRQS